MPHTDLGYPPLVQQLDETPRLFVDDRLITRLQGGERRVIPARKQPEPVLTPQAPWEGDRVYVYGTVLRDAATGAWRMWYMSRGAEGERDPALHRTGKDLVLYAESADGVAWERPHLGAYAFAGSRANNIVFDLHSPSVLLDAADPDPARRYKMLGAAGKAYHAAVSSDGIHWHDGPRNPVLAHSDTITLSRHPRTGQYLAFHKIPTPMGGHRRRVVYLSTSADFDTWSEPGLVLAPDDRDDAWVTGPEQRTEFYNLSAFPWGDQFLGLLTVFRVERVHARPGPEQSPVDGPIHAQLVHSVDGRTWQRCSDRTAVVADGPHAYDAGCILGLANQPVVHGDEVFVYYTAINTTHGGPLPPKRITVARAAWQRDRFAAIRGADATLTTPPLTLRHPHLVLNADASRGCLTVAALDAGGQALPGLAHADCEPVTRDGLDLPVSWCGRRRLPVDRPVRLQLQLRDSRLFSLRTTPGPEET